MIHQVHHFFFYKDYVIYRSIVQGNAFCSMHKREGLTDQQAKGAFLVDHWKQVDDLLLEKQIKESTQKIIYHG